MNTEDIVKKPLDKFINYLDDLDNSNASKQLI